MRVLIDLGDLLSYQFANVSTTKSWVSSTTIVQHMKYVVGPLRREITPQRAEEGGAGTFLFRMHLLPETKVKARVWISIVPGTRESQGPRLRLLLGNPSYPTLSYEL